MPRRRGGSVGVEVMSLMNLNADLYRFASHERLLEARKSPAIVAIAMAVSSAAHAQCPVSFAPVVNYAVIGSEGTVAKGDLNNDGRLDLVRASPSAVTALLGTGTGTFTPVTTPIPFDSFNESVPSTAVGDFNGDGWLDLAYCRINLDGDRTCNLSVMLGTGTGSFYPSFTINLGGYMLGNGSDGFFVAAGQLNGDGTLDLAVSLPNGTQGGIATVAVLLGTGTGLFGAPTSFTLPWTVNSPGVYAGSPAAGVSIGDLNGDSRPDLAITSGSVLNSFAVLLGTGTGSFGPATAFNTRPSTPAGTWNLAIGDLNDDGIPDVVAANSFTASAVGAYGVSMLLGTGTGSFGTAIPLFTANPSGLRPRSVAIADFNGDGKPDLVAANTSGSNTASVFLGTGGGSFAAPTNFATGSGGHSVVVGDFNGDGKPDVAAAVTSNISVMLNTTPGNPAPVFVLQPVSRIVHAGASASLTASANFVQGPAPYRWRRNGQPLSDGGNISGATTTTLTINPVSASDEAVYDLQVTSPTCLGGQVTGTSAPAVLAVSAPACPSDFNGDGVVDFFDYLDFVQAFSTGC